jgi:phage tail sheath protein FI
VPERPLEGIHIAESPDAEQPIARVSAQSTAFIGRALRGPVNRPVAVHSFADYQQIFGGLWQPSPLSYAVEHFFEQGGRHAIIVRVVNGAAPVSISLRCDQQMLTLEALAPGTREFLRASIDYDNIAAEDEGRFNLVVQRVRSPGSERIEAQETYRGVSVDPDSPRFVANVLLESMLVRVRGAVPRQRPDRTLMPGTNLPIGYVHSSPNGDDGKPLTDYDVIGSAARGTGLFALQHVEDLAFVYIPPLSRAHDIGVSTMLVAAKFCRERRTMLIVDPPASWDSATHAVQALRELDFRSDNAVMFYPRIMAMDRLRGRQETFANGGAVAGLLSRTGDAISAAIAVREPEPLLRGGVRLAAQINAAERWKLAAHGANVLQTVRSPDPERPALRTLACGASASTDGSYLSQQRFALFVIDAIARGTRWSVVAPRGRASWERLSRQIRSFFLELRGAGAFASVSEHQAFLIVCDERLNDDGHPGTVRILIQFAALHGGARHSYLIEHSVAGVRVRQVTVNRLESSLVISDELEREITIRLDPHEQRLAVSG